MDCLPPTGAETSAFIGALAVLLVLAGCVLAALAVRRRGARGAIVALVVVAAAASVAFGSAPSAHASASECVPSPSVATPSASPSATPQPTGTPTQCTAVNDKSIERDSDGDGVVDACDLDSDNDGLPDAIEDVNNGRFEDDDVDGDILLTPTLGDGVSNYLDLDSENDGLLDLFESGIPAAVIEVLDADRNGIIDAHHVFGANGLADALETAPESGVLNYTVLDTDGDGRSDFIDPTSNGVEYDLYVIGLGSLDQLGGGFLTVADDGDRDGIMGVVDSAPDARGAPGSPVSPYAP